MELIDVLIVLGFIVYAIGSGLKSKKIASQGLEEYFLAGRTLKGWQAGLSLAATQFAADTPLLVTGLIATAGIFAVWQMWIYGLSFLFIGFVLAPSWRRARVLTDAELAELRYGNKPAAALRIVKAIYFGTIFNCTVLAWVFFAATRIAEPFLLWDQWLAPAMFQPIVTAVESVGIPLTLDVAANDAGMWIRSANNFISVFIIVAVTFFYSATGGLRAVVATDVFQLVIMLVATVFFAIVIVDLSGGLDGLIDKLHTLYASGGPGGISSDQILAFTPTQAQNATGALLAVFLLQWLIQLNADGTGYIAQRSMACRSDKDAKIAAVVFSFTQILLRSLLWIPIALGLLVLFPFDPSTPVELIQAEREATFVRGMSELLPVGLKGIMLTGMLAALASTVDTHLNWGASYWTNDIYKRFICIAWLKREPSPRSLVWVARISNLLILLITLAIATQLNSIQETWQISLLLGAGVGPVLILRWLWWRMNAWAEISAILASLVLAPVLFFTVDSQAWRLLIAALGSTAAAMAAVYVLGPENRKLLQHFYLKVRPLGFWGEIAESTGHSPAEGIKEFWRSMGAATLAAVTLFCLLTGLGTWIASSPPPVWFPWREVWIAGLIVIGIGVIPLWLRLGFGEPNKNASK